MTEFKQGDRVSFAADNLNSKGEIYYNKDEIASFGEVVKVMENGKSIVVKWDEEFQWKAMKTCKAAHLRLESEFKPEYSRLEAEFKVFENKIKSRMEAAGKLILEANQIAEEGGQDLTFMWDALAPLTKAMKELGWSTSSLHC